MIRERDREALLRLRAMLMRLAAVADQYGEELDGFDVGGEARRAGMPRLVGETASRWRYGARTAALS